MLSRFIVWVHICFNSLYNIIIYKVIVHLFYFNNASNQNPIFGMFTYILKDYIISKFKSFFVLQNYCPVKIKMSVLQMNPPSLPQITTEYFLSSTTNSLKSEF